MIPRPTNTDQRLVNMPVNWTDKAVQDRLLMAVIASVDNKVKTLGLLLSLC